MKMSKTIKKLIWSTLQFKESNISPDRKEGGYYERPIYKKA
jgi:hypothetical protein